MDSSTAWVFQALFEHSLDALLICDGTGICCYANRQAGVVLGVPVDRLLGQPVWNVIEDSGVSVVAAMLEAAAVKSPQRQMVRFVRGNGTPFPVNLELTRVHHDERGSAVLQLKLVPLAAGVLPVSQPEGENFFQSLIDALPDYVFIKDRDSRFVVNNLANARTMRATPSATLGKTDFDFHPRELAEQYFRDEQEVIRTGQPLINHEEVTPGPSGELRWSLTTKIPIYGPTGEIAGIFGLSRDISDIRLREKRLAESERFIEQVTRAIPDIIYVFDRPNRTSVFITPETIAGALGYAPDDEQINNLLNIGTLMHPDDQPLLSDWSRRIDAASDDEVVENEVRLMHRDGEWRWFETRDRVFARDENGRPVQTLGVAQNITERKRAEYKLRQQNEYFKALSELTPGLMNRLEPAYVLQTLLRHACALVGTEDGFIDLVDDAQSYLAEFTQVGLFQSFKYEAKRGEGMVGRVWDTGETLVIDNYAAWPHRIDVPTLDGVSGIIGVPLKSGSQTVGVLGLAHRGREQRFSDDEIAMLNRLGELASIALDNARLYSAAQRELAERRQAEEALQKERDFISAILGSTVGLLTVLDREGRFVTFNRACEEISGYRFEEVKGQRVWDIFLLPDEVDRVRGVFDRMTAGEFPNVNINYWRMRDGSLRLIEWANTVLMDEQGRITHIVSSGVDVTSRKQLDERNLELAVEREKVKILGNFVRDASHDFRTPLSILNTNLYLLRRINDPQQQAQRVTEMERQVMQLNDLLDQLLTMTRLDTGTEKSAGRVDLNDLARDIRTRYYGPAAQKRQDLRLDLDESLPIIQADGVQLSQALSNLVMNAVQYTPDGGTIWIRTFAQGDCLGVEIRDNGEGITAKDLPYIFDRFYRGDPSRPRTNGGAGLGLPIARKIVELHGGKILVESTPGVGTVFTVLLPLETARL